MSIQAAGEAPRGSRSPGTRPRRLIRHPPVGVSAPRRDAGRERIMTLAVRLPGLAFAAEPLADATGAP